MHEHFDLLNHVKLLQQVHNKYCVEKARWEQQRRREEAEEELIQRVWMDYQVRFDNWKNNLKKNQHKKMTTSIEIDEEIKG